MILTATGHRDSPADRTLVAEEFIQLKNPKLVIIGGAKGFDTQVGWACVRLGIPFDIYLSHRGAYCDLGLYARARQVIYVSEKYHNGCHHVRDQVMVNMGDEVIAWWDGRQGGGTFYTIEYAKEKNKEVHNLYV